MPYTVWSRGRLIGETDLEFERIRPDTRAGWFRPAADVELEIVEMTVPTPAMLAFMRRGRSDAERDGVPDPAVRGTTLYADMAESLQRHEELELELRREDDTVVPTTDVAIQDTERLRQLAVEEVPAWDEESDEVPFMMELLDADLESSIDHDLEIASGWWTAADLPPDDESVPWDGEPPLHERYQIYVTLAEADAIP